MSKVNIIFLGMPQSIPLVKELGNYYSSNDDFNVEYIETMQEAVQFLGAHPNGIILFKVESKTELQNAVGVLKAHRKLVKKGLLKPAAISMVKSKKVDKILNKYGCMDLLEPNITPKTLSFKVDFWSRGLKTVIKKEEADMAFAEKQKAAKAEAAGGAGGKKDEFVMGQPLQLQSDIWLLKSKADHKKILRRWLVRMLGPSPHAGQWVELEPQPGDKEPTWKYALKGEDGKFILEDGAWFFYGSKPEFDWKTQRWNFSSDAPHLYFYTRDAQVYSRFKFEKGQLHIAENSQFAQMKEELILETCNTKMEFAGDEQEADGSNAVDGEEGDLGGHYGGKGSTDEIDGGPMSGKLRGELDEEEQEEKKRQGFQEGDQGGHWGGKSSTDNIDGGPMSGQLEGEDGQSGPGKEKKDAGFKEGDQGGHWGGKSSTDNIDGGPMSGKLEGEEGGPNPGKEKDAGFKEGDQGGHWGGKASTDEVDRSPLGGKSSTDHIDNGPLSGELEGAAAPNPGKEKDASFQEGDVGGHYGGKGSTDQIDNGPMSGELEGGAPTPNPGQEKDASFSEGDVGGHYGGKAATDELGGDPLAGKAGTDDLGGPMGGKPRQAMDPNINPDALDTEDPMGGRPPANALDVDAELPREDAPPVGADLLDAKSKDDEENPLDGREGLGVLKGDKKKPQHADEEGYDPSLMDRGDKKKAPAAHDELDEKPKDEEEDPLKGRSGIGVIKGEKKKDTIGEENAEGAPSVRGALAGGVKDTASSAASHEDAKPGEIANPFGKKDPKAAAIAKKLEEKKNESAAGGGDPSAAPGSLANPFGSKRARPDANMDFSEDLERLGDHHDEKPIMIGEEVEEESTEPADNTAAAASQMIGEEQQPDLPGAPPKVQMNEKEQELDELLGGGLTDGAHKEQAAKAQKDKPNIKGKVAHEDDFISQAGGTDLPSEMQKTMADEIGTAGEIPDDQDLPTIIGGDVDVNLESGEVKVVLKQETKNGNFITFLCKFDDYFDDELVVRAPKDSINKDSEVLVTMSLRYSNKKVSIDTSGKIVEVDATDEDMWDMLVVKLKNVDKKKFEELMSLYGERQENIHDFMTKAKGF
jgi:hypothetical protein